MQSLKYSILKNYYSLHSYINSSLESLGIVLLWGFIHWLVGPTLGLSALCLKQRMKLIIRF